MKHCSECPHAGQIPVQTYGFVNHPQPCHMLPERPCQGHLVHLEMMRKGTRPATEPILTFAVSGTPQTENHYLMKMLRERWLQFGTYREKDDEATKRQADEFRTYGSTDQSQLINPTNSERCEQL